MLWLFVILGLATFTAAGLGLMTALRTGSRRWGAHVVGLCLVAAAWVCGHEGGAGWTAMVLAAATEAVGWAGFVRTPAAALPRHREAGALSSATFEPSLSGRSSAQAELHWRADSLLPAGAAVAPSDSQPYQHDESPTERRDTEAKGALPHLDETATPADGRGGEPAAPAHMAVPRRTATFSTIALLREKMQPPAGVFVASLRRGGRRDAKLAQPQSGGAAFEVEIGAIEMEITYHSAPADGNLIDYAAAQTFDWPEAALKAAGHAAHVSFTTRAPEELSRLEVLRLHCQTHAAMAEFAPLVAIVWPDAGRMVPPASLRIGAESEPDPTDTCISFRTFALEGAEAGRTLCDTAGLHGFGLPDVQVVVDGEPGEGVSDVLYRMARAFFADGCELEEGGEIASAGSEKWRVQFAEARFPPNRRVITLTPCGL